MHHALRMSLILKLVERMESWEKKTKGQHDWQLGAGDPGRIQATLRPAGVEVLVPAPALPMLLEHPPGLKSRVAGRGGGCPRAPATLTEGGNRKVPT
jgi:hypothetical protein